MYSVHTDPQNTGAGLGAGAGRPKGHTCERDYNLNMSYLHDETINNFDVIQVTQQSIIIWIKELTFCLLLPWSDYTSNIFWGHVLRETDE